MEDNIDSIIKSIISHSREWMGKDENNNDVIVDPIDDKVIGSHYALSHFSVAMCIHGYSEKNYEYEENGIKILTGMLNRWEKDAEIYDFHYDFNNFALCVLADFWEENEIYLHSDLYKKIINCVISTPDSRHNTINWIPMRIFVNKKRLQWSKNKDYSIKIKRLKKLINSAINKDGLIEDRLPKGVSFNLQYNVSTLSLLAFNNKHGENFEISLPLKALKEFIDPAGDINFMGRGSNQIFCWGPWLYLLKLTNQKDEYKQAFNFLSERISTTIKYNNIFLNKYPGQDKHMWWDYHYSSVYISHLLFWLVMTKYESKKIEIDESYQNTPSDSGLKLYKSQDFFAVIFEGRSEYLSEKGPTLTNIWTSKYGHIFKGNFGPWLGSFGNKYSAASNTLNNYLGPTGVIKKRDSFKINHVFPTVNIDETDDIIKIVFDFHKKRDSYFNLPIFSSSSATISNFKVFAGEEQIRLINSGNFRNQYENLILHQSPVKSVRQWTLIIKK